MNEQTTFKAHVFVCTKCKHKRGDEVVDDTTFAKEFRDNLKSLAQEKWDKKEVRINASGCLSYCKRGISVVVYPHGQAFLDNCPGDEPELISKIEQLL